eukprot:g2000.t1
MEVVDANRGPSSDAKLENVSFEMGDTVLLRDLTKTEYNGIAGTLKRKVSGRWVVKLRREHRKRIGKKALAIKEKNLKLIKKKEKEETEEEANARFKRENEATRRDVEKLMSCDIMDLIKQFNEIPDPMECINESRNACNRALQRAKEKAEKAARGKKGKKKKKKSKGKELDEIRVPKKEKKKKRRNPVSEAGMNILGTSGEINEDWITACMQGQRFLSQERRKEKIARGESVEDLDDDFLNWSSDEEENMLTPAMKELFLDQRGMSVMDYQYLARKAGKYKHVPKGMLDGCAQQ